MGYGFGGSFKLESFLISFFCSGDLHRDFCLRGSEAFMIQSGSRPMLKSLDKKGEHLAQYYLSQDVAISAGAIYGIIQNKGIILSFHTKPVEVMSVTATTKQVGMGLTWHF